MLEQFKVYIFINTLKYVLNLSKYDYLGFSLHKRLLLLSLTIV